MLYENRGPMGNGQIRARFFFDTVKPVPFLPRFSAYVHAVAEDITYYSEGRFRRSEDDQHFLFHYTLRGEGISFNRHGSARVHPGEGFLSIANDPDSGYMYPEDASGPWEFLCFCFEGEPLREAVQKLLDDYGQIYTVDYAHPIIQRIAANEISPTLTLSANESAAFSYAIYTMLVEAAVREASPKFHPIIEQVRHVVHEEIDMSPTVESIAARLGYSREYLSRLFCAETGQTVKAYITRERTRRACCLLKDTTLTVAEIADLMRYAGQSNFSRSFKAVLGLSPTEFRTHGQLPFFD